MNVCKCTVNYLQFVIQITNCIHEDFRIYCKDFHIIQQTPRKFTKQTIQLYTSRNFVQHSRLKTYKKETKYTLTKVKIRWKYHHYCLNCYYIFNQGLTSCFCHKMSENSSSNRNTKFANYNTKQALITIYTDECVN